jgi:hypothetical protein
MSFNAVVITEPLWHQLPTALRAQLRRRLGRKAAIVDHQVLDVARALCAAGADDLALALYDALAGEPLGPYQGCGFGMLWSLRARMGKAGPDPTGTILLTSARPK